MLFHVSADPANLVVSLRDLDQAIEFVERCQLRAEKYLNDEVARDRHELYRLRILDILLRAGGSIAWSHALTSSHLTAREFNEAIATLEQSEQLVIEYGRGKQRRLALPEHIHNRTNGVEH